MQHTPIILDLVWHPTQCIGPMKEALSKRVLCIIL